MPQAEPKYQMDYSSGRSGEMVLTLSGRLDLDSLETLVDRTRRTLEEKHPRRLTVDLSGVDYLDSAGALALLLIEQEGGHRGTEVVLQGMDSRAAGIKALISPRDLAKPPLIVESRSLGIIDQVGQATMDIGADLGRMISFLGDFVLAGLRCLARPRLVRWGDVLLNMQRVGVDGLPIVGLISFLMGLIIAFMSSLQLSSFGANIFVASLVALAMVRELGPIITAILVAGRSGSAFAAEIGTMVVNEEVDALQVMGYDPLTFLALPKVLATAMVVPLLTLYSDLLAIVGGMLVGVLGLDLTIYTYVQQTAKSLDVGDLLTSLLKSLCFALIISGVGCQRGFQVRGGAQAVGKATTSAVVTAMFLIIVIDSLFAIIQSYL